MDETETVQTAMIEQSSGDHEQVDVPEDVNTNGIETMHATNSSELAASYSDPCLHEPTTSAFTKSHETLSTLNGNPSTSRNPAIMKQLKRRNIRNVMNPEQLSSVALEERRREQERQERMNAMYSTLSAQQKYPECSFLLSDEERTKLIDRHQKWPHGVAVGPSTGNEIVLSSDDEESLNVKRRKQSESSSSNEDSDCICLDSDEDVPSSTQTSSTTTAAESASSHMNDSFNVPDAEGRVLINIGHPPNDPDVFLSPQLTAIIKPHQIGGLRFMFDNVVETLHSFNPDGGFGCILAHSMGLGKTFQIVSFTDVVYQQTPIKRILIIVPINTLQNWLHEFEMWLPRLSFSQDNSSRQFEVSVLGESCKGFKERLAIINSWYKRSGVLIMGYEMYRILANRINGVQSGKGKTNFSNAELQHGALDEAAKALFDPGPDLVVCDEGHRIKNFKSHTAKALNSIRTKRRIVLTGYPLQNNLIEYWCMVNFVRPNYLGSRQEFANVFERPIRNGQCVDSTDTDIKLMRYRIHVLTNLLKGFVQRRSHSLLSSVLPPKQEYVLFTRKSPIQHRLYRRFIIECHSEIRNDYGCWNPLKAFAVACKIWNHPDVLYKALKDQINAVEDDLDIDTVSSSASKSISNGDDSNLLNTNGTIFPFRTRKEATSLNYRWAEEVFEDYTTGVVDNGMKMLLAIKLVERSVSSGDKVLLFSQSLLTLNTIECFLAELTIPGAEERWKKNRSYFRLDGSTSATERERLIARFNNERSVHLFLISTRAGSLGINLIGANRVIVFDASFNPCHDAQAVCRVYRYGQSKPTYIYRLVADNSMEKTIFNRQLGKQGIADRVVDERMVDAAICREDLYNLLQYNEEFDMSTDNCVIDDNIVKDALLVDVCREYISCLAQSPVIHESLMLDRSDQPLSEREKREARRAYERDKKLLKGTSCDLSSRTIPGRAFSTGNVGGGGGRGRPTLDAAYAKSQRRSWTEIYAAQTHFTPTPMSLRSIDFSTDALLNSFPLQRWQSDGSATTWNQSYMAEPPPAGNQMPDDAGVYAFSGLRRVPDNTDAPASEMICTDIVQPELITLSDDEN